MWWRASRCRSVSSRKSRSSQWRRRKTYFRRASIERDTRSIMTDSADCVLRARGIGRGFPGVRALDGVDLCLRAGEVHALMGQNGAGKSTLIKVLTGVHPPDAGSIELDGRAI